MIPSSGSSVSSGDILLLFLSAILLRAIIFLTVTFTWHVPLERYTAKGDGESYLAVARAMLTTRQGLTQYDRRVFPGYPTMIAMAHCLGLPYSAAALAIDWLAAGAVAAASAMLFNDRRVGLATVMLFPHYLTNSALAMSEAPMLALATVGLMLAARAIPVSGDRRQAVQWRPLIAAGFLLGAAGLVRPMACFATLGFIAMALGRRRILAAVVGAGVSLGVVLVGIVLMQYWTGDVLEGLRIYQNSPNTYGGRLIAWPFESLIFAPFRPHMSVSQAITPTVIVYIWVHVALVLSSIALLTVRCVRGWDQRAASRRWALDLMALVWLAGNTAFVLCIGNIWGFLHFPRFSIPALPALFSGVAVWLPKRAWSWITWLVLAAVMAVISVHSTPP